MEQQQYPAAAVAATGQQQQQQPQGEGGSRPSFTTFWKRSKEALSPSPRKITFVNDDAASGSGSGHRGHRAARSVSSSAAGAAGGDGENNGSENAGEALGSSLDKHQLRRAQVRKAQVQHRQRKANYVKQLEIDVARIRELITTTQREAEALRKENEAIRIQIQQPLPPLPVPPPLPLLAAPVPADPAQTIPLNLDEMDFSDLFNEVTMSLTFDDVLNAPTFRIKSPPSSASSNCELSPPSHLTTPDALPPPPPPLDPTEEAINFVLALEHICRNHFHPSNFQPSHDHPFRRTSGHTLMASSLALQSAPRAVFSAVSRATPLLRRAQPGDLPPAEAACEWSAAGLTLQALHGLACSINDASVEVAPVQAWFELAARVPGEVLLRREVLDALKRELAPLVRCPHFGAQMERGAFESVVGRVVQAARP